MESLPKGLLTTATKVSTELDGMGPVDVGDVVQLWRVYSANPSAHDDDVGYRLENFFWRIWGSQCLSQSLRGSTLANLFLRISDPNPFSLVQLSRAAKAARSSTEQNERKISEKPSGSSSKVPLHPILKKPRNGSSSGEPHKTTRLLLTDIDGQSTTRKPSNPPTPVPPSAPTMGDTAPRQTQKKAFVVASKAKNMKRRPVIMRRKSLQQSSGTSSARAQSPQESPQASPPQLTLGYHENPPTQESSSVSDAVAGKHCEDFKCPFPDLIVSPEDNTTGPPSKGLFAEDVLEKAVSEDKPQEEQLPDLPALFLSDLRELLDTDRPAEVYVKPPPPRRRGFYSIKSSPPKPNFFSSSACRRYDARYLSTENYEQPSSMKLVDKNFRQRFSDRVRQEQVLVSSIGAPEPEVEPKAAPPKPIRAESSSTITNATLSPSRFGDSHGNASTAPSSTVPFRTPSHDDSSAFSTDQDSTDEDVPSLLTPFSMPPSRSQLSLMIERSRQPGTEENEQVRRQPAQSKTEIAEIEEIEEIRE
ncbi:hypothetical protein BO94DRAFT_580294 [Aspergillus sclerotioniger CBS 115572]|uniref:Nitrogen regulatory protein areA GATA-like domain-containing protein n=1 Tax=Aspergillus sclerotioniger CBS 115572 TaxID=1450535 RepID=A0A317XCV1_9EURO|nr:hypothetical protein BO94DRAFT_580294 [Aspergillus sclerotioniger CBS 115572]PWY96446.1 hypothetical protein BO94DRAFT_580294 [Aspergillus sclerotioniger CBS 115572]